MTECLKGDITIEQVKGWTDQEWRVFQFNHMVESNKRLSKLERQASWRNVLTMIPWAIVGGMVMFLIG